MIEECVTITRTAGTGNRIYEVRSGDGSRKLMTSNLDSLLDWIRWELIYLERPEKTGEAGC